MSEDPKKGKFGTCKETWDIQGAKERYSVENSRNNGKSSMGWQLWDHLCNELSSITKSGEKHEHNRVWEIS